MLRSKPLPPQIIWMAFKYSLYALLTLNILWFYLEESLATTQTFSQGIGLADIIQGYAATIDTAAWVLLILFFELETYLLDDRTLSNPRVQSAILAVRAFAYGFVLYACYGYINKLLLIQGIAPFRVDDICALVGQGFTTIDTLDEYPPLDAQSCRALVETDLYKLNGQQVLGSAADWQAVQRLAWVDVINSVTWILVVAILEIDVWLQLRDRLKGLILTASKTVKIALYSVLIGAAAYWGFKGDFLDFWDSFLWILAFFFIELNLLQWQAETKSEDPTPAA
ncbi:MAG: hypothetical protein ACPHVT_05340 [Porticoccaceae bacterium]